MSKINFDSPGRMINGTKRSPKGHICVFNANVCIKSKGKIWFGDIDITADSDELVRLAKEVGEDVYVLREMDARFEHETSPQLDKAVAVIRPAGSVAMTSNQ